jgi:hypothetical protein
LPKIGATPGATAGTRSLAVFIHVDRHQPRPSLATGEPADPLGPPLIVFAPVVDDDEPRSSIVFLILRPPFAHTVSGLTAH